MARKAFLILFLLFQAFSSYAETLNSCKSNYSFLDTNKLEKFMDSHRQFNKGYKIDDKL